MKKLFEIIIGIIITILITRYFETPNNIFFILIFTSSFVLYKYIMERYISKMYVILVLLIVIFFYAKTCLILYSSNEMLENNLYKLCEYTGKITRIEEGKNSRKVYLKLDDYKEEILMYISNEKYNEEIFPGYKIKVLGVINLPNKSTNLGQFDEKKYLLTEKIHYKMFAKSYEVLENKKNINGHLLLLNKNLCNVYDKFLDNKNASIIKAMIFGNSELLDDNIKRLYTDGGIIHILAISGMHVNVISSILESFMRKLRLKPKIIYIFSSIFLIFYMFLTGMSISTVRAVVMNVICYTSKLLNRQYSMLCSLIIAAILILAYNPLNLFSIGFLLSFISVFIIKVNPKFDKIIPFISENISINISVFLALMPIISFNFYEFQGLSILANIFIIPFTKTLIILSILILFSYSISLQVASILAYIVSFILKYFEIVLNNIAKVPISRVIVGNISINFVITYYILFGLTIYILNVKSNYKRKENKNIYKIWMLTFFIFIILSVKIPSASVTFLDVEHGDAAVIKTKLNKIVLIDGGGKSNNDKEDVGTYVVYPYLKYLGINEVEVVIVTHPDNDHIKGIIELIGKIKINKIILPKGKIENDEKYVKILEMCSAHNINVEKVSAGYHFKIDDMIFDCIYPFGDVDTYNFKVNNYSLVFLLRYKEQKILFTGDIEKEAETLILERIEEISVDLKNIDILKVPHHGSSTSSSEKFINYISPQYAIVSGDDTNTKSFNNKVKWNYKKSKTKIYHTSIGGMIKINLEGKLSANYNN